MLSDEVSQLISAVLLFVRVRVSCFSCCSCFSSFEFLHESDRVGSHSYLCTQQQLTVFVAAQRPIVLGN